MVNSDEIRRLFNAKEISLPLYIKVLLAVKKQFDLPYSDSISILDILKNRDPNQDKIRKFAVEQIKHFLFQCNRCSLHNSPSCTQKVPAEGNICSPLMIIGEGPGFDEDKQGRPFVGKAGQLLNTILSKLGIARQKVYISNVVKCRPPGNRTPLEKEVQACSPNLELELAITSPKVIITLGSVPLNYFLPGSSIMRSRGQWINMRGIWIMPTYHPAYILRQQGKALYKVKWQVWDDFNNAIAKVKELCPDYDFNSQIDVRK